MLSKLRIRSVVRFMLGPLCGLPKASASVSQVLCWTERQKTNTIMKIAQLTMMRKLVTDQRAIAGCHNRSIPISAQKRWSCRDVGSALVSLAPAIAATAQFIERYPEARAS